MRISGRVRRAEGPLIAPMTERPCLAYQLSARLRDNLPMEWASAAPFWIGRDRRSPRRTRRALCARADRRPPQGQLRVLRAPLRRGRSRHRGIPETPGSRDPERLRRSSRDALPRGRPARGCARVGRRPHRPRAPPARRRRSRARRPHAPRAARDADLRLLISDDPAAHGWSARLRRSPRVRGRRCRRRVRRARRGPRRRDQGSPEQRGGRRSRSARRVFSRIRSKTRSHGQDTAIAALRHHRDRLLLAGLSPRAAVGAKVPPVVGRWDLTITGPNNLSFPSWGRAHHRGEEQQAGRPSGRPLGQRPPAGEDCVPQERASPSSTP